VRHDPRSDVDGETAHFVARQLHLAGVDAGPDPDAGALDGRAHRLAGPDPALGAIEEHQEAVTGGRHLATPEALDDTPGHAVMACQLVAPVGVA